MGGFLYALLMMSVSGSIMFLAAELLYKRTGGKSAGWYYSMLVTSVMLFLIPLSSIFSIPKLCTVTVPEHTEFTAVSAVPAIPSAAAGGAQLSINPAAVLLAAYSIPAAVMLIKLVYEYLHTRKRLLMASSPSFDPNISAVCGHVCILIGVRRRLRIRTSHCIKSPMLLGIITPYIILPEKDFTDYELTLIFKHELTHLRHMDILVKLCTSIVCALHWFNPLVYRLKRAVNNCCELCCDESVLKYADRSYKKDYGMLLISVIERSNESVTSHTTAMAAPAESVKHRLTKIIEFKRMSLPARIVTTMVVMSIAVCSVTVLGFETAATAMPESLRDTLLPSSSNDSGNGEAPAGIIADIPASPSASPAAVPSPSASAETAETALPSDIPREQADVQDSASYNDMVYYDTDSAESLLSENEAPTAAEQETQTFTAGAYIADTAPADTAVPEASAEPFVPSLPESSYVFDYDFADTGLSEMENRFTASEDCIICVYRCGNHGQRADIAVYDISDGGRLIYDSSDKPDYYSIYIRLKQGHEYLLRAFDSTLNENIYIYAETDEYMWEYYDVYE